MEEDFNDMGDCVSSLSWVTDTQIHGQTDRQTDRQTDLLCVILMECGVLARWASSSNPWTIGSEMSQFGTFLYLKSELRDRQTKRESGSERNTVCI